jgi:hypothetical protein
MKHPSGGFVGSIMGFFVCMIILPVVDHPSDEELVIVILVCMGTGGLLGTVAELTYRRRV